MHKAIKEAAAAAAEKGVAITAKTKVKAKPMFAKGMSGKR